MASMSFSKSLGSVVGAYRLMVSPSFEIRNLVKFHLMSLSFSTLLLCTMTARAQYNQVNDIS